jgi:hypothetical protein
MNDDVALYRAQSFGGTVGIGARPALCIVDFVNGFVDPRVFGGGNIRAAVANTVGLLAAARRCGLPVAFSRVVFAEDGSDDCVFMRKVPALAKLTERAETGRSSRSCSRCRTSSFCARPSRRRFSPPATPSSCGGRASTP